MLRGSLSTVSLAGIVQLLGTETRTGRLDVSLADRASRRVGSAWLVEGRPVHAEARRGRGEGERLSGEDAFYELVLLEEGEFAFEPGVAAPAASIRTSMDHLLMEAACRRDHVLKARSESVDPGAVPAFAPVPDGAATPRFNTLQWRLLASIDGRKDVGGLARDLGLSVEAVWTMISELSAAGVLRLS